MEQIFLNRKFILLLFIAFVCISMRIQNKNPIDFSLIYANNYKYWRIVYADSVFDVSQKHEFYFDKDGIIHLCHINYYTGERRIVDLGDVIMLEKWGPLTSDSIFFGNCAAKIIAVTEDSLILRNCYYGTFKFVTSELPGVKLNHSENFLSVFTDSFKFNPSEHLSDNCR